MTSRALVKVAARRLRRQAPAYYQLEPNKHLTRGQDYPSDALATWLTHGKRRVHLCSRVNGVAVGAATIRNALHNGWVAEIDPDLFELRELRRMGWMGLDDRVFEVNFVGWMALTIYNLTLVEDFDDLTGEERAYLMAAWRAAHPEPPVPLRITDGWPG